MADRYFDRNGATAGFGTLTGAWDTTTASWSTSSAGTATPAAFTFTNADAAWFGSDAVGSTTAGTATISTAITVTLNGIYTRNLTAAQTVAAAGTGALVFAGTSPFVNAGRSLAISAPVSGSAGLSLTASTQFTYLYLSGTSSGLTGPLIITQGDLWLPGSNRYAPSSLDLSSALARLQYVLESADATFAIPITGTGAICISGNFAGNGITFPASPASGNIASFAGRVQVRAVTSAATSTPKVRISELPAGLSWVAFASAASPAMNAQITYTGSGETKATALDLDSEGSASTAALTAGTYALYSSGSGPIILTGTVQRTNTNQGVTPLVTSARMSLALGGSNTGDNTLSGDISEVGTNSAILGITKVDAGRWVLSGANSSHTGIHTISAGTLSAQSAKALGSATSAGGVTIQTTGVLELGDGITLDKSATDFDLRHSANPVQTAGTSTLQTKQITLTVTPTFTVPSGRKLTIAPQGAGVIIGSGTGITKAGDGELELTAKANTYTGAVTVSAGTLTVGSVANAGAASAWGQASSAVVVSGTLKYTGAEGSSNRAVQMTGSAPTLDASGSGALTLSNVTQDTTAKTMTLRGSSSAANTISNAIANNTGAVSVAKEDAGKWVLPGALSYTGTTAVNGGTLRVQTANSNTTSGAVTIGASGTVELVTNTLASAGATSGEVLGTGNVTVNGGTIKTRGGTTQKGQVRYGGNLTFGSGSTLYIGAAA